MSRENVKVVREAWEAAERHDNEAIFPLYDADVESKGFTASEIVSIEASEVSGSSGVTGLPPGASLDRRSRNGSMLGTT